MKTVSSQWVVRALAVFWLALCASSAVAGGDGDLAVLNVSEQDIDGRNQVCIRFSAALDRSRDLQSYFSIGKKQGERAEGAWIFSSGDRLACFSDTQPSTDYRVVVFQGLPAKNGAALGQDYRNEISTRALRPAVSFGTRGAVLMPGISRGLPVVTVNVPAVDITFHRVKPGHRENVLDELEEAYTYSLAQRLAEWTDLVYTGRFDLHSERNRRVKRTIEIATIPPLQRPGMYLAVMKPAGSYPDAPTITHFMITDLGLHARVYANRLDLYVNSLKSTQPVSGVTVSLLDAKGQVLKRNRTTVEGYVSFQPVPEKAVLLLAEKGSQQSLLRLKGPALDLSEFDLGERLQDAQTLFVYSERDIYRPGEPVHFDALLRDEDGRLQGAPTLKGQVFQPDGQVVRHFRLRAQKPGFYEHSFKLPKNASTGAWRLEVEKPDGKVAQYPFKVEEFLPERMKLTFSASATEPAFLSPDQPLRVKVKGEYLYGAPASGNRLSATLQVTHWRSPVASLKGFQFGDIQDRHGLGNVPLEDVFLDPRGRAEIVAKSRWGDARSPLKLRLVCSLFESGGRPVTRSFEKRVWPGKALIGIRPQFKKGENPPANRRVHFDLVRATADGRKLAADALQVTLIREERQYFWEYSKARGWDYKYSKQAYPVGRLTVRIPPGGQTTVAFPVEWGDYRLEVTDPGSGAKSSLRFFAGDDWYSDRQAGAQSSRPDAVGLSLDKPRYSAGDTAKLTVKPPHDGEALILVEGDTPLWTHRQQVRKAGTVVEIPVDKSWQRHDIHVSVVVLRAASKVASITPNRAFGLLYLPLDREARRLQVGIDSVAKTEPGKPLEIAVKLKNRAAIAGPVWVTVAAVDVGILNLTDFKTPDPFTGFFGRRRYGVESRDNYGSVIELNRYRTAALKFGGDAPSRGGKAPASDLHIVSLHSGPVVLDAEGKASVTVHVPDFNGRLRLMAVAFSDDSFGSAEREVTVAAPVVTQLAMPRFIASGDHSSIALDLHNMSGGVQMLRLKLTAEPPLSLRKGTRTIKLADGEKETLHFPLDSAYGTLSAHVRLDVAGDALHFSRVWKLAIRPPYPPSRLQWRHLLGTGESAKYPVDELRHLIPETISGTLTISSRPDLGAARQMAALLQYPYGCLEQVSSAAWPWLFADNRILSRLDLATTTQKQRLASIEEAWRNIEAMQLEDGGFGLWSNHSEEEHWLTAYVTDLLLDAEAQGYPMTPEVKQKALHRLEDYLRQPDMGFGHYTDSPAHYRVAFRSYAAYVLSRVNRANLGKMRSLYDHEMKAVQSGLPLVHLGLALLHQGDRMRGEKAIRQGLKHGRDAKPYLGDYGSAIRDDALMIRLLSGRPQFRAQVQEKLQSLSDKIAAQPYLSTQERNAVFLASVALQEKENTAWQAVLTRGRTARTLSRRESFSMPLDAKSMRQGITVTNRTAPLLWTGIAVKGYPDRKPAAISHGYEISREYFDRDGRPLDIRRMKIGDLVLVHLKVSAKTRMPDTLVVDLLPAGLELENQNLGHSIKLNRFRIDGETIPDLQRETRIVHQEFRHDRFVAAVDMGRYGEQESHLFYLARAVTPGEYHVPPPMVEAMYRPQKRAIGESVEKMRVVAPH